MGDGQLSFNGSGTFSRIYNWVTDRSNGIKIRADRMDEEMDGMAAGLSNCVTRDGQSTIAADTPWNNKKITGLADATGDTHALNRQTGDARYNRNANALSNETTLATDDEITFWDASASANKAIAYSALRDQISVASNIVSSATGDVAATNVQAAIAELASEKVPTTRTVSAAGLATGGGALGENRTITVTKSSNGQAIAGSDDTTAMTPVRTKEAIAALMASSGSNSNGSWIRFADGTQICRTAIATGGAAVAWTFPQAFVDTDITLTANSAVSVGVGDSAMVNVRVDSATQATLRAYSDSGNTVSRTVHAIAIGRWY